MSELEKAVLEAYATSYVFYAKTFAFHWNVTGGDLVELEQVFGEIYAEVYSAIDAFSLQLNTLEITAPSNIQEILDLSQIKETSVAFVKEDMISNCLINNETVLKTLHKTQDLASLNSTVDFQTFLADRITAHEKHSQMLSSLQ
jgi:DNA-binding ferritin-like protein